MTTPQVCPRGHPSTDPDFCSECGVKLQAAAGPATEQCPNCGIERVPGARFCETCRYDFKTGTAGPPPVVAASPSAAGATVADPLPAQVAIRGRIWEAVVTVDPALDVEPDPNLPCPTNEPERTFPLDQAENLVGRRSTSRGIFPVVSLDDPGVSHRHLMLYRNADGRLDVSDLGSTNGTFLNGSLTPLTAGVKTPVTPDDHIELGRWTRIIVRPRD